MYYIYKTTNLINGNIYIGKHKSNNIQSDKYLGSGKYLNRAIKKYGRKCFKRQILYQFETQEEAFQSQSEIVNQQFISRKDTYNNVLGGYGFNSGYFIAQNQEGTHYRIKRTDERHTSGQLKSVTIGLVSVKDRLGNNLKVKVDDPRYISGQLQHNTKGLVTVKDSAGKKFDVSVDDPRYKSGELVQINRGMSIVKDENGNNVRIPTEQKNKLGLVGIHKGMATVKDSLGNIFHISVQDERYKSGQLKHQNYGTIVVKDKDGNKFRVSKDDPRYLSGQLVGHTKGNKRQSKGVIK